MKPKQELLRVVKQNDGTFTFNPKAQGRGAYMCYDDACINQCIKKKLLNKAYKMNISDDIYNKLNEEYAEYKQQN